MKNRDDKKKFTKEERELLEAELSEVIAKLGQLMIR